MSLYRFWLLVVVFVLLLALLLSFRTEIDSDILLVRNAHGEIAEIAINDLMQYEGLLYENVKLEDEMRVYFDGQRIENPLLNWFERYRRDKGENLLRVYYINDIIEMTGFENQDFNILRFESLDGASVVIQPRADRDWLILMTLERENENLSLRLIMPMDNFSQRWLKNVVRVTFE
ncbi:MAG: hypothetical protein FWG98_10620 [Candidatus Cloacimonetes bacterium]|nr:hypothetical protein [Candidatus Cloacimonadota bacterium]